MNTQKRLVLICCFSLFIKQGLFAETDLSQRDGPFVIAGQVGAGAVGLSVGFLACSWSLFHAETLLFDGEFYGSGAFAYGGLAGAMVSSAATVYLIGETFGSGGGSFKHTLRWAPLTPIGATIAYQRSKNQFAETDLPQDRRQRDALLVMLGQVDFGLLGLVTGIIWGAGIGGAVSSVFTEDREAFPPAEFFGGAIGGIFLSAVSVYAIGELYGSGGGSFKETLKWSVMTPIGATIGYQQSKLVKPARIASGGRKRTLLPPTIAIQSSQLPYHRLEMDYLVRLVNVRF